MTFAEYFRRATGDLPYSWQERVAAEGLPEVIDIETGAGKTAGVAVGWLYRLLHHEDSGVRASTPPWLVVALPMRSLVDQTHDAVGRWLAGAGETEVECFRLLGGEGRVPNGWRERPGRPTIIVGTIDMVLSRALMRGFAASRWTWPIDFGLLHSGVHFVFDEVQLLGPALATSRQLEAFRRGFGTAAPCSSTWMSATLDAERLRTVDNRDVAEPMQLSALDRERGLERRLSATRTVEETHITDPKGLAGLVSDIHRPGTRTLVVVNLVKRAQEVAHELRRQKGSDLPIDLLHSRFRRSDRAEIVEAALGSVDPDGPGRILVATQVVEAGVDISSRTLITDLAPWSSVVQRAGRCNRAGEYDDARLVWTSPPRSAPYEDENLATAAKALRSLEGHAVTSTDLRELGRSVAETVPTSLVLRRRDLLDLFDTSPDLVGNDVDVSRFIRDGDDTDIEVAWRRATPDGDEPFEGGAPSPDELCRVAIGDARKWLRGLRGAWTPDHLAAPKRWVSVLDPFSIQPGTTVVVDVAAGGYDPLSGWDPSIKRAVPRAGEQGVAAAAGNSTEVASVDESLDDDPATFVGAWVRLADHLDDAKKAAEEVLRDVVTPGLSPDLHSAIVRAAALHDVGKAHPVFQDTLVNSAPESLRPAARSLEPLAKSGGTHRSRHRRRHFRHELVSVLMLISHEHELLADHAEPDLIRYLVGAHHGRVRVGIRSMPGEVPPRDHPAGRVALGVADGDVIPPVVLGAKSIGATTVSLDPMVLGSPRCWTTMALGLRDRVDIGPFRLAAMEALVRVADWRASATPSLSTNLVDLGEQGVAEVGAS